MTIDEAVKLFEEIGIVLFNHGDAGLSGGYQLAEIENFDKLSSYEQILPLGNVFHIKKNRDFWIAETSYFQKRLILNIEKQLEQVVLTLLNYYRILKVMPEKFNLEEILFLLQANNLIAQFAPPQTIVVHKITLSYLNHILDDFAHYAPDNVKPIASYVIKLTESQLEIDCSSDKKVIHNMFELKDYLRTF